MITIKRNREPEHDTAADDMPFPATKEGFAAGLETEERAMLLFFAKPRLKIAISTLQRELSIGYTRARETMMELEARGYVSAADEQGRRRRTVTRLEYETAEVLLKRKKREAEKLS